MKIGRRRYGEERQFKETNEFTVTIIQSNNRISWVQNACRATFAYNCLILLPEVASLFNLLPEVAC